MAEKLHPKVKARYFVDTFSHLYAGKTSIYFFRKWKWGYAAFNQAAREAFAEGKNYTADFDLTAFYDSLDHRVLRHFLEELGFDREFCGLLFKCLGHWTATQRKKRIYQGHGIPEGPLGSGLLAEVVLQHLDSGRRARPVVRYLRYVDDIRLFGTSEAELRRAVTELDYLSKDVGLFPQTAKIRIHQIVDIEAELKTVSGGEFDLVGMDLEDVDQESLHKVLAKLSPRSRVGDETRFRYLLAHACPRAKTNDRLWKVLERQPHLYDTILRYFQRYQKLPPKAAVRLITELERNPLYAAIVAELIWTAEGRLSPVHTLRLDAYVRAHWRPREYRSADVLAALGRWAIMRSLLPAEKVESAVRTLPEWWARAELVAVLDGRRCRSRT